MVNQRIQEVLLRYKTDQASLQQTKAGALSLIDTLDRTRAAELSVEDAAKQVNRALKEIARASVIDQIARDFHAAEAAGMKTSDALAQVASDLSTIGATENEIRRVTAALVDMNDVQNGGRSGNGRLGSLVGQVISSSGGAGGQVAGTIGQIIQVGEALGPTAVAATAAGLAISALTSEYQRQAEAAKNVVTAQTSVADLVGGGATPEEIQQQIDRIGAAGRSLYDQADQYAAAAERIDQLNESRSRLAVTDLEGSARINQQIQEQYDALSQLSNGQVTNARQLATYFTELDAQQTEYANKQQELTRALEAGAFAAAAEARELAARNRQEITNAQNFLRYDQMTRDAREELRSQLQAEANTLQSFLSSGRLAADVWNETDASLRSLNAQIETLGLVGESTADRLAAANAAQEQWNSAQSDYFDAISATADAQAKLAQTQMAEADAEREHALKIVAISRDMEEKQADIEATAAEARKKQTDTFEKERLRIEKRYASTAIAAVANRDALAFLMAQKQRKDDLDALSDSNQERLDELQKSLDKQLKAARDNAVKAAQAEQDRYSKEAAIRNRATLQALTDLTNARNTEAALKAYYNSMSLTQESNARSAQLNVQAQANAAMVQAEFDAGKARMGAFQAGMNVGGFGPQQTSQAGFLPTPFANYPAILYPAGNSSMQTNTFNISGGDPNAIARAVDQRLRAYAPRNMPTAN